MCSVICACQTAPGIYIGLTKRQPISRIGIPAAIDLYQRKPAHEYWAYYQRTPEGRIEVKYFAFSPGGRVETHYSDVDRRLFVSPDNPSDEREILAFRKSHLDEIDYDRL
jgi:hypothetical protein